MNGLNNLSTVSRFITLSLKKKVVKYFLFLFFFSLLGQGMLAATTVPASSATPHPAKVVSRRKHQLKGYHRRTIRRKKRSKRILPPKPPQPHLKNLSELRLPSTTSLFSSLKHNLHPNWIVLLTHQDIPTTTNRIQMAMILGVLMTNGHIALEAQNGQEVKNIGRDMMLLTKYLGVNQGILPRINRLIDLADHGDWDALRHGLEATEQDLKQSLLDQQDSSLVGVMTITAWLRANELMVDILHQYYHRALAAMLYQPALYERINIEMGILPEKISSDPLVEQLREGTKQIAELEEGHAREFHPSLFMQRKGNNYLAHQPGITGLKDHLEGMINAIIPPTEQTSPSPSVSPSSTTSPTGVLPPSPTPFPASS